MSPVVMFFHLSSTDALILCVLFLTYCSREKQILATKAGPEIAFELPTLSAASPQLINASVSLRPAHQLSD